jgi:enoyl-CoA hydratase
MVDIDSRYSAHDRLKFDWPRPGVLRITMTSPVKLNAMDAVLHREISEIWPIVDADPSVSSVIVTGAGNQFSAGGDLQHEIKVQNDRDLLLASMKEARNIVYGMINCSKPIVSAVRGWAVGGGLACAIMADISIVARDARLSDGHTKIGVAAGDHAAIIWPLLCGMAKAKYLLLLCEPVTGAEAERIGLVSLAVDDGEVEAKALDVASRLSEMAPSAVRWTKYALNNWLRQAGPIFDTSLALEFLGFTGPEAKEGLSAFLEKRKPVFPRG